MTGFTPEQRRELEGLLDQRLKSLRHTHADHLDRALLAQKIMPDVSGDPRVLGSDGSDTEWVAPGSASSGVASHVAMSYWSEIQRAREEAQDAHRAAVSYRTLLSATNARTAIAVGAAHPGTTGTAFVVADGLAATVFTSAAASQGIFYFDPDDYTHLGPNPLLRIRYWAQTETDPTDSTLQCIMYPVSSTSAGVITVGTAVAGSTSTSATIAAANTRYTTTSNIFDAPSAGHYVLWFNHSAAPGQTLLYGWTLQLRMGY